MNPSVIVIFVSPSKAVRRCLLDEFQQARRVVLKQRLL
jgi:hypothetical protein